MPVSERRSSTSAVPGSSSSSAPTATRRRASTTTATASSSGAPTTGSGTGKKKPSFKKVVKKVVGENKASKAQRDQEAAMKALRDAQDVLKSINAPKVEPPAPAAPASLNEEDEAAAEEVEEEEMPSVQEEETALEAEAEQVEEEEVEADIPEPVRGKVTVEVNDFNHEFDIEDGKLSWETVDLRFGITSGEFDGLKYAAQFGADFPRPMFLKSQLDQEEEEAEEVDEPFSRDCYFGLTVGEVYVLRLPEPPRARTPPKQEKVKLKFNHYCDEFPILDGELTWHDIDAKYAISFAYKGNYGRRILDSSGSELTMLEDSCGDSWVGLKDGETYTLKITEDQALATQPRRTYQATGVDKMASMRKNMNAEFGEDSANCSCIEGNPCVSAYNCKNWNNRFEVARANGWKGHG